MASLSVQVLRSQFESIATKNVARSQPIKVQNTSVNRNIDIDDMVNEACAAHMDDDVFSSYGDDDDTPEATTAEESVESSSSTPENYVEIATTNPYGNEGQDSAKTIGKHIMGSTNTDIVTITVTLVVDGPVTVRTETTEEALSRLERELEMAHLEIEEEQEAVLRHLLTPSIS